MEDFNKNASNPEEIPDENDEELSIFETQMVLQARQQSIQEHIKKLEEEMLMNKKKVAYLEDSFFPYDCFQSPTFQCSVSPIRSPICESQNLSEDAMENFPESTSTESSRQPDNASIDSFIKELEDNSNRFLIAQEQMATEIRSLLNSPTKRSYNEIQATGSNTDLDSLSDLESIETNAGSIRYYAGKGKEAENPKFRYRKRSREVSSCGSSGKEANTAHKYKEISETKVSSYESLSKDSPAKCYEEALSTSQSTSPRLDSHTSKAEKLEKISSPMKRKGSESNEKDNDRWRLDESFATTSGMVIFGNHAENNDGLEIFKKRKLEGAENMSRQYPGTTPLFHKKAQEPESSGTCVNSEKFMQTDQTTNEKEPWNLPSTSWQSNVGGYISSGEESSLGNSSDLIILSDRGNSPLRNESDMSPGEREESSLGSGTEVAMLSRKEDSPLRNESDMSPGERAESSFENASDDASFSGNNESLRFRSGDKSHNEKERNDK